MKKHDDYLNTAANWLLDNLIMPEAPAGTPSPKVRVTRGWPRGASRRAKNMIAGACHPRAHSSDNHNEVFINPTITGTVQILDILCHELCHAIDDCQSGHRGAFARLARRIGLEGKLTATHAGADLKETLDFYIEEAGTCPTPPMTDKRTKPKQSTRMIKLQCSDCGFTARTSRKWIERLTGYCPVCQNRTLASNV